jgi:hypothetical protein
MSEPSHLCRIVGRARRSVVACLTALAVFAGACSTTGPRVLEVTGRIRLHDVEPIDQEGFLYERASRIRYEAHDLAPDAQREEFYVHWRFTSTSTVNVVKFEYRQVARPNTVLEQTYVPHQDTSKTFAVRGEEFRSGGAVSAWRVSLWNDDQLLAEKKTVLR